MLQGDAKDVLDRVKAAGQSCNACLTLLRGLYRAIKEDNLQYAGELQATFAEEFNKLTGRAMLLLPLRGLPETKGGRRVRKRN